MPLAAIATRRLAVPAFSLLSVADTALAHATAIAVDGDLTDFSWVGRGGARSNPQPRVGLAARSQGKLREHLIPLAVRLDREAELAAAALSELVGATLAAPHSAGLAQALGALRRAVMTGEPATNNRIESDSPPLRHAWDGEVA